MSFKFQWAPLIADTSRAREMLTTALNKSPKPPIIVDDIVVTELNLGSTPPELEILEVGDIAEDRFRGIFKMSYSGDAYLTLKTRVQANPLNTFLSAKPSFASPQPLAASSGLTIPLQITLSDIILSGFVVLVFSRQKGITLVFRNDPLESLKVSSTFDSIPFVRDYLQKEIEQQLRILFMEDLPAIIHRLSLKLWVPDHLAGQIEVNSNRLESSYSDKPQGANVTPSQRAKDRDTDDAEVSPFSLDGADSYVTFSQKNLLKLAALNDCNRTLALFTPSISDVVYRAWAGSHERADATGTNTPGMSLATLSRVHASNPSLNSLRSADTASTASGSTRPPLTGHNPSTSSVFSASTKSRPYHGKKRRKRVVDLRKRSADGGEEHHTGSRPTTPPSSYAPSSSQSHTGSYEREGEVNTPHDSPEKTFSELHISDMPVVAPTPRAREPSTAAHMAFMDSLGSSPGPTEIGSSPVPHSPLNQDTIRQRRAASSSPSPVALRKSATFSSLASFAEEPQRRPSLPKLPSLPSQPSYPNTPGAILAQAWIARIQADVDRKWQEERRRAAEGESASGAPSSSSLGKLREQGLWGLENGEDASPPPPAYHV